MIIRDATGHPWSVRPSLTQILLESLHLAVTCRDPWAAIEHLIASVAWLLRGP